MRNSDPTWKPSKNDCRSSSALSILSAYSPMIQIIEARASGSSKLSKLSHKFAMIDSYLTIETKKYIVQVPDCTQAFSANYKQTRFGKTLSFTEKCQVFWAIFAMKRFCLHSAHFEKQVKLRLYNCLLQLM